MSSRPERRVPIPLGQRLRHSGRTMAQMGIWLGSGVGALFLLYSETAPAEFYGLAQAVEIELAFDRTGLLAEVLVEPYQELAEGDVVALLDDSMVAARLETARLQVQELEAQLAATVAIEARRSQGELQTRQHNWVTELRRFQIDETNLELDLLRVKVEIETDRLGVQRLIAEVVRARGLADSEVGTEAEAVDLELERVQLEGRIEANQRLLASLEAQHQASRLRREGFSENPPIPLPADPGELVALRAAVSVATASLSELSLEKDSLVLRTPKSGRVRTVDARKGEVVLPGRVVVVLSGDEPDAVFAYLPEGTLKTLAAGDEVEIRRPSAPQQVAVSRVVRLSPTMVQLPVRLWKVPDRPEFGRVALVDRVPSLELIPGELVEVRAQ